MSHLFWIEMKVGIKGFCELLFIIKNFYGKKVFKKKIIIIILL